MKKMNKKIREFSKKMKIEIQKEKVLIDESFLCDHKSLCEMEFECYSNENQYFGETKNKIFLSYCDHFRGNLGTDQQCNELTHPHVTMDDRGYIKGVAFDLVNYMKLKSLKGYWLYRVHDFLKPTFSKSKHSHNYCMELSNLSQMFENEVNEYSKMKYDILEQALYELTGCSLLYYIQPIN